MKPWTAGAKSIGNLAHIFAFLLATLSIPAGAEPAKEAGGGAEPPHASANDLESKMLACRQRAAKRHGADEQEPGAADPARASAVAMSGNAAAGNSQQCIECGRPCVLHGTPCCAGTEADDCWGVCEGKFPNTYCQ